MKREKLDISNYLPTILRIALGVIFITGGYKLAFAPDRVALAASYTNPAKGWISPYFVDAITNGLGFEIGAFLAIQGWIEMLLGLLLVLGVLTPVVGVLVGFMFWSFTIANPIVGEIRLSRDIALMGLCLALAVAGPGAGSIDSLVRGKQEFYAERRDAVLLIIRFSLAYTLIASSLFSGGVMSNHLNTTIPVIFVLLLGVFLVIGVYPQWIMAIIFLWMLYIVPASWIAKGFFLGLDSAKREFGFLAGSFFYLFSGVITGPDCWAWPKKRDS